MHNPIRYVTPHEKMTAEIDQLRADLAALRDPACDHAHPCTCGSGAHPRRCERHPLAYDTHVAELNEIAASDATIDQLRADLAASQREVERLRQQVTIIDDGIGEAKAEVERCRGIITDLCGLHCTGGAADFDSERLGPNNDALRYLAEIGRVEIVSEQGRRVVARWIP